MASGIVGEAGGWLQRSQNASADLACLSRQGKQDLLRAPGILDLPLATRGPTSPLLTSQHSEARDGELGFSVTAATKTKCCLGWVCHGDAEGVPSVVFWAHDVVSGFQVLHGCVHRTPPCAGPTSDFRVSWEEAMLQGEGSGSRGPCGAPHSRVIGFPSPGLLQLQVGRSPVICHTSRTF